MHSPETYIHKKWRSHFSESFLLKCDARIRYINLYFKKTMFPVVNTYLRRSFSFKWFERMVQRYLLHRIICQSFHMIFDSVSCQIFPAKLRLCQFPISLSVIVSEIVLKYDDEQAVVVFRPFSYFDEQVVICASPSYRLIVDVSLRFMSMPRMNIKGSCSLNVCLI